MPADEACQNETQYKNIVDLYLSLKENPENVDTDQLARQQNDKTLACLKKHGIDDDSVTGDAITTSWRRWANPADELR